MAVLITFERTSKSIQFKPVIRKLIRELIVEEEKELGEISIIFTSNEHILEINRTFLNHHYFTDVITFPDSKRDKISGDIYISLDEVRKNARRYNSTFNDEVTRVVIHGILHLIGYDDVTPDQKIIIRKKEDSYLSRFKRFDFIVK